MPIRIYFPLLFVVFLVLKLAHVIAWSWWWVTAPLWAPFALVLPVVFAVGLFTLVLIPVIAVVSVLLD